MTADRLVRDPWLRGCAVAGALLAAVSAIDGLPLGLWLGWAYLVVISVADVSREPCHTAGRQHVWQDRRDE